ncbi:MAG: DUF3179 domain-containing protein [Thermoanaerobaculales bacterium]|nr:DUF3179 domain-containing protein [Thermoanaerobaculales bacterium]
MSAPGLIRSGWWVAVAAVVPSALVVTLLLRPPDGSPARARHAPIALEPCLVDPGEIVEAMARDGLAALTSPAVLTPTEVARSNESERGKLLVPSDLVIGVELGGQTRAYPLRLLRWHEAVNDVVGGRAIAVTSSPLAGSMAVWDRTVDGRELSFGVSGRLLDSTTLLYDRQPADGASSLWHQLSGEAVAGPAAGRRLEPLPAALMTWADWYRDHPTTTVMSPDPGSKRLYKRDPYHSYRGSDLLRFPVDPLPPAGPLRRKDVVAVVTAGDVDAPFALRDLAEAVGSPRGTWAAPIGDAVYLVEFDAEAGSVAARPRDPQTPPPPVRVAYWFAWYALHPDAVTLP